MNQDGFSIVILYNQKTHSFLHDFDTYTPSSNYDVFGAMYNRKGRNNRSKGHIWVVDNIF